MHLVRPQHFHHCETKINVDKSTDNAEPHLICCLPQYAPLNEIFILGNDQDSDTNKDQALSITFSQSDCFISQNEGFLLAMQLRVTLTQA